MMVNESGVGAMMNVTQAAMLCGRTRQCIYRAVKEGRLVGVRPHGLVLVSETDLERYAAGLRQPRGGKGRDAEDDK